MEAPTKEGTRGVAPRPAPAPALEVKVGANFGDAIELTQLRIEPGRGVPGESVRVMAQYKGLSQLERDYFIFVHVEDVDGRVDRINVDHPPRQKPTSQWQAGEVIQDVFDIPIPAQMQVRGLSLILGFWDPTSDRRLPIVNKGTVADDGRDRLIVAKFPVLSP